MISANYCKQQLVRLLEKKGMERKEIPGFIWCLKSCLAINPALDCIQLNKRLQLMGWEDFILDDDTFQLLVACYAIKEKKGSDVALALCGA